ncbi:MAG: zinc ribbon domain-containing protein, partial [Armatimonadota bacterium]
KKPRPDRDQLHKELESLEMEIEALSRTKDRLEEAILELLDRLDEDAREISQQERIVAELAREVDSIRETYSRETQRLSTEIDSLERQRQDVAQHISARTLAHYDKLREKNSNLGIVRVIDGVCEGCNVRVALSKMQRLETLGNETFCDNCKRYLYLEK